MMSTYDEMAVAILLGSGSKKNKQAKLNALAKQAAARMENRVECPECGSKGPHDDNGCTGSQKSYCCSDCGCCFDEED